MATTTSKAANPNPLQGCLDEKQSLQDQVAKLNAAAIKTATENVFIAKKKWHEFIIFELLLFLSQVAAFCFMSVITLITIHDKKGLLSYVVSRVDTSSFKELGLLTLGVMCVLGFIVVLSMKSSAATLKLVNEFKIEIPRAIYAFGASLSALSLVFAIFLYRSPEIQPNLNSSEYFVLSLYFALIGFVLGCAMTYWFKREEYIL